MELNRLEAVLRKIKGYGGHVYLHVMGEPLLHPDFPQILELCARNDFRINVVSNGTLAEKYKRVLLSQPAIRQISFSLQCVSSLEPHFDPEKYFDNIFTLVAEGLERTRIYFCLRLWNFDARNSHSNQNILRRIKNAFNLSFEIPEKTTSGNGIKLLPNLYLSREFRFDWPCASVSQAMSGKCPPGGGAVSVNQAEEINDFITELNPGGHYGKERAFCRGLRDQIAILVDGTLVPCCLDNDGEINLGNIFESELDEILVSERARNIYNGFSEGKTIEPLCRKCSYRKRFSEKTRKNKGEYSLKDMVQ